MGDFHLNRWFWRGDYIVFKGAAITAMYGSGLSCSASCHFPGTFDRLPDLRAFPARFEFCAPVYRICRNRPWEALDLRGCSRHLATSGG
jgi:hypothetical protein